MTLCIAWVRQIEDDQELIFATDSCLSGGERWHSGVKLFELPRKDCLICFSGNTDRTYPLILNLISSIKFDNHLANPNTDIKEVLDYLTNLFTNLCHSIGSYGTQDFKSLLGDFSFLFGGWSWKDNKFLLWKIEYNHESRGFLPIIDYDNLIFTYIGDGLEKVKSLLIEEYNKSQNVLSGKLDIEPLKVLIKMIRDRNFDTIDGAVQFAKVYPPGITEFFGVVWPSVKGEKTFLGKDVTKDNNPTVRFIDPDSGEIIGESLPESLNEINRDDFDPNYEFVKECYPAPDYKLKDGLSSKDKQLLRTILNDHAYKKFIKDLRNDNEIEKPGD